MTEAPVAVVVTVPSHQFADGDDLCNTPGNFVCRQLESHLVQHGHSIPDWIKGGCDEDWGVYFRSTFQGTTYEYLICFFAGPLEMPEDQVIIQYSIHVPLIKRLFRKSARILPNDPMHETMRTFGEELSPTRMLTLRQFDQEY